MRGLLCLLKKKNSNANDHICWNNGSRAEIRPSVVEYQTNTEFEGMKFFLDVKNGNTRERCLLLQERIDAARYNTWRIYLRKQVYDF